MSNFWRFIKNYLHLNGAIAEQTWWQETIVRDVFGVIKPNGKRQFNHCFVEVCQSSRVVRE